jgi:hypothetical protein
MHAESMITFTLDDAYQGISPLSQKEKKREGHILLSG